MYLLRILYKCKKGERYIQTIVNGFYTKFYNGKETMNVLGFDVAMYLESSEDVITFFHLEEISSGNVVAYGKQDVFVILDKDRYQIETLEKLNEKKKAEEI
jgi:hypothetical protein